MGEAGCGQLQDRLASQLPVTGLSLELRQPWACQLEDELRCGRRASLVPLPLAFTALCQPLAVFHRAWSGVALHLPVRPSGLRCQLAHLEERQLALQPLRARAASQLRDLRDLEKDQDS